MALKKLLFDQPCSKAEQVHATQTGSLISSVPTIWSAKHRGLYNMYAHAVADTQSCVNGRGALRPEVYGVAFEASVRRIMRACAHAILTRPST